MLLYLLFKYLQSRSCFGRVGSLVTVSVATNLKNLLTEDGAVCHDRLMGTRAKQDLHDMQTAQYLGGYQLVRKHC